MKTQTNTSVSPSRKKAVVIAVSAAILLVIVGLTLLTVWLATRKDALDYVGDIRIVELDEKYTSVIDRTDSYLGHPDFVVNDEGKLIVAYPAGHGKGAIIMKESSDFGDTWNERISDLPKSFEKSQETPTLYNLGGNRLLLVSGCPSWAADDEYYADGFNYALSTNGGETWSKFENAYGIEWANNQPDKDDPTYDDPEECLPNFDENGKALPYDVIVAMSSLTQLRDENGDPIDKWMGTFHDYDFFNYVSYLTFDKDGNAHWSEPKKFLHSQRETEQAANLCEIEIFRAPAPNDDTLILIGRGNSRTTNSLISVSTDEGETWSELKELPLCLTGDRHKAEYDATTGKVLISFRLCLPGMKSSAFSTQNLLGGYWVGWVGDPQDLIDYATGDADKTQTIGDALIVLGKTNDGGTDCGYSGTACRDGVFVLSSYGKFDAGASVPFIMQAKFKLSDVLGAQ